MATQAKNAVPLMNGEMIEKQLEPIMNTPDQYLTQNLINVFVAFSNGYVTKPDRKDEFLRRLKAFADKHGITGLMF